MRRPIAWGVAILLHVGVPTGAVLGFACSNSELPPLAPPTPNLIVCTFPTEDRFTPLSLLQGATGPEVNTLLGIAGPALPPDLPGKDTCLRYRYTSERALTVLFREGRVRAWWPTEGAAVPPLCAGVLRGTVRIESRPWYPARRPESPRAAARQLWTKASRSIRPGTDNPSSICPGRR